MTRVRLMAFLILIATAVGSSSCGANTGGTNAPSPTPSAIGVYTLDGVTVQWCERMDFRALAVMPGDLVDGRPMSHVGADQLLCSRSVVDKDPAEATMIVATVQVFATVGEAKEVHERSLSTDSRPLGLGVDVDEANMQSTDRNRYVRVRHRNLRVNLTISGTPALMSAHSAALDQAMPSFAARIVRMMQGQA